MEPFSDIKKGLYEFSVTKKILELIYYNIKTIFFINSYIKDQFNLILNKQMEYK